MFIGRRKGSSLHSAAGPLVTVEPSKSLTLLWGATGEQVCGKLTYFFRFVFKSIFSFIFVLGVDASFNNW